MNLASSGAGILAINRAGILRQTSIGGGGVSRPLKCMEISKNKFRSTEHGSIELRWLYMWDPQYSDSELSGKSREEICPYTRANSAGGAPRREKTINAVGITQMVGVIQTSGRIACCRLVNYRVISSVGNEFLIGIFCFVILQPAMFTT